MENLHKELYQYSKGEAYPFHMPGHKRNTKLCSMGNPYELDITEIEGFDNLHHADGILKKAMDRCAGLYGAKESFFLVNGSSCGILAGIAACTKRENQVLMARNCHKSVYHGVYLNGLKPLYLYPPIIDEYGICGGISAEMVETMLTAHDDIKLVILTSPTYEGIVSDIEGIAKVVHREGIPLLVDEAHGAHFGFHEGFPKSAVEKGADLVVQSVHKTLPALTQSALLHLTGERVNPVRLKRFLSIYQTSSPSYLLMAGIDRCMELIQEEGKVLFKQWNDSLDTFNRRMRRLKNIRVGDPVGNMPDNHRKINMKMTNVYDIDKSKIIISPKNITMTGKELYDILIQEYSLVMEAVSSEYVLAMTGLGDRPEGYLRLGDALLSLDERAGTGHFSKRERYHDTTVWQAVTVMPPYEADLKKKIVCPLSKCQGRTAGDYVYLYPPGIPLLVPGERIGTVCIEQLGYYEERGLMVIGLSKKKELEVLL